MKERHAAGLGVKKSSEIIPASVECRLLESKVIGLDSPQQLLNGVIYFLGIYLALHGVSEHNNLRRPGCDPQITIGKDSRCIKCLIYREDPLSKTNQGGLSTRGRSSKIVYVYPTSDQTRDPVTYYKKYCSLLAPSTTSKKLYCRAKKNYNAKQWFCDQPYGINKIKSAVKEMCKEAGIVGKFTNHSLRATCASRMYSSEIPEQIIKETTGHRSDCVRTYKRTADHLRENACKTLVVGEGPVASPNIVPNDSPKRIKKEKKVQICDQVEVKNEENSSFLSFEQMEANVRKTRFEMRKKMYPKSHLKLKASKRLVNNSKKHMFTIDLNVNVNNNAKSKKQKSKKSTK